LSRFASVNEAQAEWEPAREILSDPCRRGSRRISRFEPLASPDLSLPKSRRPSGNRQPKRPSGKSSWSRTQTPDRLLKF